MSVFTQPDVKLLLDEQGVICDASVSESVDAGKISSLIGQKWADTVAAPGQEKIATLLGEAKESGVTGFRELGQRFPSGLEIPVEYTAVWLGGPTASAVAIGRNLQAVADLQSRLLATQQTLERDYWKLRDIETRYRQLFEASNEAVILARTDDLSMIEANPSALRALGMVGRRRDSVRGRSLLKEVSASGRDIFLSMLGRVRESGKAPGVMVRLGPQEEPWIVRASLFKGDEGPTLMLQLSALVAGTAPRIVDANSISVRELFEHSPEGFVALNHSGEVRLANRAFLQLLEIRSPSAVVGNTLDRWFARPGVDLKILLANVRDNGSVRTFHSILQKHSGAHINVEICAFTNPEDSTGPVGILMRDSAAAGLTVSGDTDSPFIEMIQRLGESSMRSLVAEATDGIESLLIKEALHRTRGNRTAAAELLGLSRQSLYAKLSKYGFDSL